MIHLPVLPEKAKSRVTFISFALVMATLVATALALIVLSVSTDVVGHAPAVAPPVTTVTTRTAQTATHPAASLPVALQPNAAGAAGTLISGWATGNREKALSVATPTSVVTLFAVAYPEGLAIARGCSTAFPPLVCTYGPPGGASPTDAIYQLHVSQAPGGWYVSSVVIDR